MKSKIAISRSFFRIFYILPLLCALIPVAATAQSSKKAEFTTKVPAKVKKAVHQALSEKIDPFYEEYSYDPYLHYFFVDLNNDKKNEIVVRFAEEFEFRDRRGNVDTHIFAQTSKGLIEILEVQASDIAVADPDYTGLNQIFAFKNNSQRRYDIYGWDGQKQYVRRN